MFIQTEATTDPQVMKFYPGQPVLDAGHAEFPDLEAAARSPLAQRLFGIDGVASVALDGDYVAVAKDEDLDWTILKPSVLAAIMDHFMAGEPVVHESAGAAPAAATGSAATGSNGADTVDEADAGVIAEVRELIDTRILPAVSQSGGSVAFHSFQDGTVYLELGGSAFAMLNAIQNMICHYVDGVRRVCDHRDALPKPGLETEIGQAVAQVIDQRINPAVAAHGGHIALVDVIDDKKAVIRLEGGCQGCGMAAATLRQGVEVEIKNAVPQITDVLDVTDHAAGDNPYYQPGAGAAD